MNTVITKYIFLFLIIISLGVFAYFKIVRFIKVDSCLDHGGRWNYELDSCEYSENVQDVHESDTPLVNQIAINEEQAKKLTKDFLELILKLPESKSEINKYLTPFNPSDYSHVYHEYIEDYKIESFDNGIVSVIVKPKSYLNEIDSDWTTKLYFSIIQQLDSSLIIQPSVSNRVLRSFWKKEIIKENNSARVDYSNKWISANLDTTFAHLNILNEINDHDLSYLWGGNNRRVFDGVFGKNYHRIRLIINHYGLEVP